MCTTNLLIFTLKVKNNKMTKEDSSVRAFKSIKKFYQLFIFWTLFFA